ncbi:MAG: OmpA family protein [Deltaproteobacteria bacterium]|nr:OmpA family protein [Deltaproteobacteria bacterium]
MKTYIVLVFCLALFWMTAGCADKKSLVVLVPDPDGRVGQLEVANEGGRQVLSQANQAVRIADAKTAPSQPETLSEDEIRAAFSQALASQPRPPVKFILYFLPSSDELTEESTALLPQILQTIRDRNSTDIVISGHTDTVGSREYNYRLSLQRAQELSTVLALSGVPASDITTTSHGEGNPLVKTADEVEEPRNRRVEVVIR